MKRVLLLLLLCSGCQYDGENIYKDSAANEAVADEAVDAKCALPSSVCNTILLKKTFQPLKSQNDISARFLNSHNDIRKLYGLAPLVWSQKLANYAKEWANYLRDKYRCKMNHRSALGMTKGQNFGENLAWNWSSRREVKGSIKTPPEQATYSWAQECKDYDFGKNICRAGKVCGHFTQMVWKNTRSVGCAVASCDDGSGHSEIAVCNYDPPGNITMIHPGGKRVPQKPF